METKNHQNHGHHDHQNSHHHWILPTKIALGIGGGLLVLTWLTVSVADIDLGSLNFVVAMIVATVKASLVAMFFMGLKYDHKENAVIFGTSFLFLAIFFGLTVTDLFFLESVPLKSAFGVAQQSTKSKYKKPWESAPELIAAGKPLFVAQCVACHGADGKGDGPAAAAMRPMPRNFTQAQGWKNGRKPSEVYKTLKEGIPGSSMASFATLPPDDLWAMVHYVLSLGPAAPKDAAQDLAKLGIDSSKEGGGGGAQEAQTIPVEVAMELMAEKPLDQIPRGRDVVARGSDVTRGVGVLDSDLNTGERVYQSNCVSCHGSKGEGHVRVQNLGVISPSFIVTEPLRVDRESLKNATNFERLVRQGLPGNLMPGFGNLSSIELQALYQYTRGLKN